MPRQPQAVSGLFGETPQAIRQSQIDERINRASMIGNLTPGGHGALAGGMLARGISGLMGAAEDPRLRKAQIYQEIEQNITQMGLRPGTPEFTRAVTQQVTGRLGTGAGIEAQQKAQQLEVQQAKVQALRSEPIARQRKIQAQAALLGGLNYGEDDAFALIDAGLGDWAIKQKLTPTKAIEKIELYKQVYGERWKSRLGEDLGKAGFTIENNIGGKAASQAERESVRRADGTMFAPGTTIERMQEELAAGTAIAIPPEQLAADRTLATEAAKLKAASANLPRAVADYERAFELENASIFGTEAYEIAKAAKRDLATQIAIVESRGAEPGNVKLRQVIDAIPDFAGPIDRLRFVNKMSEFKRRRFGPTPGDLLKDEAARMLKERGGG